MILTGWKEISKYLRYGIRTAQRWEAEGLPVRRIRDSRRSPVVADSEELDSWILHSSRVPANAPQEFVQNLRRAQELRHQIEQSRKELQRRMQTFHEQLAEFREKREKIKKRVNPTGC